LGFANNKLRVRVQWVLTGRREVQGMVHRDWRRRWLGKGGTARRHGRTPGAGGGRWRSGRWWAGWVSGRKKIRRKKEYHGPGPISDFP
jgi:hypothetical protein